jgi:hypothetical protein
MFRASFDAEPQTTLLLPRHAHDPLLQHMQHVSLEFTSKPPKYLFCVSRVNITVEKWTDLSIARALQYRGFVNGSGFETRPVHVGFVVYKMAQRACFFSNPVSRRQYYSTHAPYSCFFYLPLALYRGHGRASKPINHSFDKNENI